MVVKSLPIKEPEEVLTINLANDEKEVRGFGMPITCELARQMVKDYVIEYEKAAKYFSDGAGMRPDDITAMKEAGLESLSSLFSEKNHIISGVFGKEILLQILAQKNCEGIRYIFGRSKGEVTLILLGVNDSGIENIDGKDVVKSKPLDEKVFGEGFKHDPANSIIGEVHGSSRTVAQLKIDMKIGIDENISTTLTNKMLSVY